MLPVSSVAPHCQQVIFQQTHTFVFTCIAYVNELTHCALKTTDEGQAIRNPNVTRPVTPLSYSASSALYPHNFLLDRHQ
jgi:hypothetical protein